MIESSVAVGDLVACYTVPQRLAKKLGIVICRDAADELGWRVLECGTCRLTDWFEFLLERVQ